MDKIQQKAYNLIEALPYIQKYSGSIFVIKYGGNAMIDDSIKNAVMGDIALLKHVGINPIVVHGGGPMITKEMQKAHIKPKFVNGLRYTDAKTMQIVKNVSGMISGEIKKLLENESCKSENITDGLIKTKIKNKSLGLVGDIAGIDKSKIFKKIKQGIIPIIGPYGHDGKHYNNINADTVATKVAEAVNAEKLTILTNVEGVYENGKLITHLSIKSANTGIKKGVINKGMIPKVKACINAVEKGVKKAHLIDGTYKHSLLLEFFTVKGIGTEIVK
ncbi:MAG: acetylglutamate kinase [Nanoarchaeota archaeon]